MRAANTFNTLKRIFPMTDVDQGKDCLGDYIPWVKLCIFTTVLGYFFRNVQPNRVTNRFAIDGGLVSTEDNFQ